MTNGQQVGSIKSSGTDVRSDKSALTTVASGELPLLGPTGKAKGTPVKGKGRRDGHDCTEDSHRTD